MRMAQISERHEIRVRGKNDTIVFVAESDDGRLVIRQERDGEKPKDACSITLADPAELRDFFHGLRRILASLGYEAQAQPAAAPPSAAEDDRDAVIAKASQ